MVRTTCVLSICAPCALAGAQGASLTPLGDLPGSIFQSASSYISADGKYVTGYSQSYGGFDGFQAFRWDAEHGMVGLGELPGGTRMSRTGGISPDGSRVVGVSNSSIGFEAMVWSEATGMFGAGRLPGDGRVAGFGDISLTGVAVGSSGVDNSAHSRAVRWTQSEGMTDLGVWGYAMAVTPDGTTIVGNGHTGPFRWTAETGITVLADLPGGDYFGTAAAISDDGRWIAGDVASSLGREACIWKPDGTVMGLGQLGGLSYATGISNDGRVVVGIAGGGPTGFVWTAATGMLSIADMMKRYGYDLKAAGWTINELTGLSADGQYMCGTGFNPSGDVEAVLIHIPIPAPSSLALGLAALGYLASRPSPGSRTLPA